jgi:hypothetical protein
LKALSVFYQSFQTLMTGIVASTRGTMAPVADVSAPAKYMAAPVAGIKIGISHCLFSVCVQKSQSNNRRQNSRG